MLIGNQGSRRPPESAAVTLAVNWESRRLPGIAVATLISGHQY